VLAAGKGERFGALKQFESVGGQRLVDRAIALLEKNCSLIVLVLPKGVNWSGPEVDAAVPGWTSPDVIKRVKPDGSLEHIGREEFLIVQGPIACRLSTLRQAIETVTENIVEETEAIERIGGRVVAVEGNSWSHHVVDAKDLDYIARILPSGPK